MLSLVALRGGEGQDHVLGHALFTPCHVDGRDVRLALLGPLCVDPDHQRCGIGGALVRAGLTRLAEHGVSAVYVLGDPNYYARFGFTPEARTRPPFDLPAAWRPAWRSLSLAPEMGARREMGPPETPEGVLRPPRPWRDPRLWGP